MRSAFLTMVIVICFGNQGTDQQFRSFVSSFAECQMPILIDCGQIANCPGRLDCMVCKDTAFYLHYGFGSSVFGRLFPEKPFFTVLSGDVAEFDEALLQTFSASGEKIDSLYIGGGCGGTDTYWAITHTVIGNDQVITSVDTTFKWIDATRRVFDPDSTIVQTVQHRITDAGKIIHLNTKRIVIKP